MTFAEKLKELRTALGWTQSQLADHSGVPIGTIRDYEQGKRDPLLPTIQRLARGLGVSLAVFDDVAPSAESTEEERTRDSFGRPRKAEAPPASAQAKAGSKARRRGKK
jgi:transcriptional regulator with XRE-family HTH domain